MVSKDFSSRLLHKNQVINISVGTLPGGWGTPESMLESFPHILAPHRLRSAWKRLTCMLSSFVRAKYCEKNICSSVPRFWGGSEAAGGWEDSFLPFLVSLRLQCIEFWPKHSWRDSLHVRYRARTKKSPPRVFGHITGDPGHL